jgi:hypothetical protein
MGEKCRSTPRVTIHKRPESSKLCLQIVHNRLRKRPYTLCKSCRGSKDLQLWYSSVCPLQFNFLEKNRVKACQFEPFWPWRSRARRRRRASPRGSAGPARRGRLWPVGPRAGGPSRVNRPCAACRVHTGRDAPTPRRPTSSVAVVCVARSAHAGAHAAATVAFVRAKSSTVIRSSSSSSRAHASCRRLGPPLSASAPTRSSTRRSS